MDCFKLSGMFPVSRHCRQKRVSGAAIDDLHLRRKIAGTPSGPAAELGESSLLAVVMSLSLNLMLLILADADGSAVLLSAGVSDGEVKTELNCFDRISAISLEFEVNMLLSLRSGPTGDLILAVHFAKA